MTKVDHETARQLGIQLAKAEWAIDAAMIEASRLATALIEARATQRVAITVGGEAVTRLSATIRQLADARADLVATHEAMDVARADLGVPPVMVGGLVDKPNAVVRRPLRAVG